MGGDAVAYEECLCTSLYLFREVKRHVKPVELQVRCARAGDDIPAAGRLRDGLSPALRGVCMRLVHWKCRPGPCVSLWATLNSGAVWRASWSWVRVVVLMTVAVEYVADGASSIPASVRLQAGW